jgi:hypothetical protein
MIVLWTQTREPARLDVLHLFASSRRQTKAGKKIPRLDYLEIDCDANHALDSVSFGAVVVVRKYILLKCFFLVILGRRAAIGDLYRISKEKEGGRGGHALPFQ